MKIRKYEDSDIKQMVKIWNEVVESGNAFPQIDPLDIESAHSFFKSQTYCGVAILENTVVGLYILHPNNIGRCGHISNASYAISSDFRGRHIGEAIVLDSLKQAKKLGFQIMQFNAVVEDNIHARHLYERLGFEHLGTIKDGFFTKEEKYKNICIYIKNLD